MLSDASHIGILSSICDEQLQKCLDVAIWSFVMNSYTYISITSK